MEIDKLIDDWVEEELNQFENDDEDGDEFIRLFDVDIVSLKKRLKRGLKNE